MSLMKGQTSQVMQSDIVQYIFYLHTCLLCIIPAVSLQRSWLQPDVSGFDTSLSAIFTWEI